MPAPPNKTPRSATPPRRPDPEVVASHAVSRAGWPAGATDLSFLATPAAAPAALPLREAPPTALTGSPRIVEINRAPAPAAAKKRVRIAEPSASGKVTPERRASPSRGASAAAPHASASALSALLALSAAAPTAAVWPPISHAAPTPVLGAFSSAPLFPREFRAPLPADFKWPRFERFAFFEHRGSFRDAWGIPACSVADRPTDVPPADGNYHFVMDVFDFLAVYPYPIIAHTSSVPCTCTAWANRTNWQRHVETGAMWHTCESFLFMLHVGVHAACEHSHSMLEYVVGPPDIRTTTHEHGRADDSDPVRYKSFLFWLRNLSVVAPSHVVPERLRLPRASHPDPEVRMLLRSAFPRPFAEAHTRVWNADIDASDVAPCPIAASVSPHYHAHRACMVARYAAFTSRFAPSVSSATLACSDRPRLLIAVPIAMSPSSVVALVPTRAAAFATPLLPGVPLLRQMMDFSVFLPCHVEPQELHITRDSHADIIFAMPCLFVVPQSCCEADAATPACANLTAGWCPRASLPAAACEHAALALERCLSFVSPVPWLRARIGVLQGPQPVVKSRAAAGFRDAPDADAAAAEWRDFLATERRRHLEILHAFEREDGGSGLLSLFLSNICTAASLASELVPPPQGLPPVRADTLALHPYPPPPAELCTAYLARMPPQALPPGFPPSLLFTEVLAGWGRRIIYKCLNATALHDFECYRTGSSDRPRHPFVCIGPGAFLFYELPGGGRIRLNQIILINDGGVLRPMDFRSDIKDHKDLAAIMGIMGFSTDKELLSFLIHGMRWKVEAPRHIRISHNVFSLKERARGVGEATAKLIERGLYTAVPVRGEHTALDDSLPCPCFSTPFYAVGMGGADKKDSSEKRPCGNTSDPPPGDVVRERNSPHGEPDGELVQNFNELTGPKVIPPGYTGHVSFPDPETKVRSRSIYAANAVARALAHVNGTYPCASCDDIRWMFFQFYTEPCEHWLQVQYLVLATCVTCGRFEVSCACGDGTDVQLFLYRVAPRVINMGTRPSSKVAVRFAKTLNVEWRARMADYVQAEWLPRQTQALRDVLADREHRLGYEQAHPFWTEEYTDNFYDLTIEVGLSAHGALVRRHMAKQINLWMSKGVSCGTVADYIGGRHCLTGGFGTLVPAKRVRAIMDCARGLRDELTRDEMRAHNSFLVHACDILNFDRSLLQGNWAPLQGHGLGFLHVVLSAPNNPDERDRYRHIREHYAALIVEISTRPAAAFFTGVLDAPDGLVAHSSPSVASPTGVLFVRMSSDCRADSDKFTIFGALFEYEWRICLSDVNPTWLLRHITVGESCGALINIAFFGEAFSSSHLQLVHEGDNTSEGSVILGTSKSPDQLYISERLRETAGFQACKHCLWWEHSAGLATGYADAGTRDKDDVLDGLAAAFGRRRTRLDLQRDRPDLMRTLADILEHTTEYRTQSRFYRPPPPNVFSPVLPLLANRALVGDEAFLGKKRRNCSDGDGPPSQRATLSPTPPRRASASAPSLTPRSAPPPLPPSPVPLRRPIAGPRSATVSALEPTPPRMAAAPSRGSASSPHLTPRLEPSPPRFAGAPARAPSSPQPMSAEAARAADALHSAQAVVAHTCTSAADPIVLERVRALCVAARHCEAQGIPKGTSSNDSWGFSWVRRFAQAHSMSWMRPRVVADADKASEDAFAALAIFWIAPRMRPHKRTRERGIAEAKPPSAVQAVYGWRRVQRDCGRYVCDMGRAGRTLRGLTAQYLTSWGQDALTVRHHVPIARHLIVAVVTTLVALLMPKMNTATQLMLCAMITFATCRGPRLNELCGEHHYRRANFVWVNGRTLIGSTARARSLGSLVKGLLLRVQNPPSKTDRSGAKWGGKYMWYRYDPGDTLNFAAAWAAYEERCPCPEEQRRVWPAFSMNGDAVVLTERAARSLLSDSLAHCAGAEAADTHTWHDFRATIATAVIAAKQPPALAQALVCWASPESVDLYGQMLPEQLADAVQAATATDAARHAHLEVPHYDFTTVAGTLLQCADVLDGKRAAAPDAACSSAPAPAAPVPRAPKRACAPSAKSASAPTSAKRTAGASVAHPASSSPAAARKPAARAVPAATKQAHVLIDVGPPLGRVQLDASHPASGMHLTVPNSLWDPGVTGSSKCCVAGLAVGARIGRHRTVFVVRECTSAVHYPFTAATLRSLLPPARHSLANA